MGDLRFDNGGYFKLELDNQEILHLNESSTNGSSSEVFYGCTLDSPTTTTDEPMTTYSPPMTTQQEDNETAITGTVYYYVDSSGDDSKTDTYLCGTDGCAVRKSWRIYGQCQVMYLQCWKFVFVVLILFCFWFFAWAI